jgi:hypothetical protein
LIGGVAIAFASALAIGVMLYASNAETKSELEQARRQLDQVATLEAQRQSLESRLAAAEEKLKNNDIAGANQEMSAAKDDATKIKTGLGKLQATIATDPGTVFEAALYNVSDFCLSPVFHMTQKPVVATVKVTGDADGKVEHLEITGVDPPTEACIRAMLAHMQLPASGDRFSMSRQTRYPPR